MSLKLAEASFRDVTSACQSVTTDIDFIKSSLHLKGQAEDEILL